MFVSKNLQDIFIAAKVRWQNQFSFYWDKSVHSRLFTVNVYQRRHVLDHSLHLCRLIYNIQNVRSKCRHRHALSVCAKHLITLRADFDEILRRGGACPTEESIRFDGDLDSFVDPGSFSRILYHHRIGRKLTLYSVSQQVMNGF